MAAFVCVAMLACVADNQLTCSCELEEFIATNQFHPITTICRNAFVSPCAWPPRAHILPSANESRPSAVLTYVSLPSRWGVSAPLAPDGHLALPHHGSRARRFQSGLRAGQPPPRHPWPPQPPQPSQPAELPQPAAEPPDADGCASRAAGRPRCSLRRLIAAPSPGAATPR